MPLGHDLSMPVVVSNKQENINKVLHIGSEMVCEGIVALAELQR
jgi:primosomal replication protein N